MSKKIILFGGSFDPIHLGHIGVANCAFEKLNGDELIFIPAHRSPHKMHFPNASDKDRFNMISLAIEGNDKFRVSDCEFNRKPPSYTLDTVRYFSEKYGKDAQLYWLIGADTVSTLGQWYGVNDFIDECNVCVMLRGGMERPDFAPIIDKIGLDRAKKLAADMIITPLIECSSTDIRKKIAQNQDTSTLLDTKVEEYIKQNGLYLNP